jgi:lysine-specific demethylase 8
MMKTRGSVPRITEPSVAEFTSNYLTPQLPVIIAGIATEWKARASWTLDHLKTTIGSKKVQVKVSSRSVFPDFSSTLDKETVESSLGEFIDLLTSDRADKNQRYLTGDEMRILSNFNQIDPDLDKLRADFTVPHYFDQSKLKTIGFWLSARGVSAWLHYDGDGSHNLNVQVRGTKRVLLFSPNEDLYPFNGIDSEGAPNFSEVDILAPDEGRFPLFCSARCLEAVLEEGDILFIPSYWYHAFFHLGPININVNFWWQPEEIKLNRTSGRALFIDAVREARASSDILSVETQTILKRIEYIMSENNRYSSQTGDTHLHTH